MTRHKLTRLKKNIMEHGADEKTFSLKAKQSVVTTLKLFASQNCEPDLYSLPKNKKLIIKSFTFK